MKFNRSVTVRATLLFTLMPVASGNTTTNFTPYLRQRTPPFQSFVFQKPGYLKVIENCIASRIYAAEYCHREKSSHGGSAIFVLDSVTYKRRFDLSLNVPDCESVWIEIESPPFFNDNKKNCFWLHLPFPELSCFKLLLRFR